jgi:hypothetical protein
MFTKVCNKRKSDECWVPENGLQKEKRIMEELTVTQESVGKEEIQDTDIEMQVEKKVKLEDDISESAMLVSITVFYSSCKHRKFLSRSKLNAFSLHRPNWQALCTL